MDSLYSLSGTGLYVFLDTYGGTRAKQEILLFWALHPSTKFSGLAVLSAIECPRTDVERALVDMISDGLIDVHTNNGLVTYSLTSNEDIRRMVALFSALDWGQRRIVWNHPRLVHSACNLTPGEEAV